MRFNGNQDIDHSMPPAALKSDVQLKADVLAELSYEPKVNVTDIGVLVHNGAVTLTGFASSYAEKWESVAAAKRVDGVRAIADDIRVNLPESMSRTDGGIAEAAANRLRDTTTIPSGLAKIVVADGWITLTGEMDFWYQKAAAEDMVKFLPGVKGLTNCMTLKPTPPTPDVDALIRAAFVRSGVLHTKNLAVESVGNSVTLRGQVRTCHEQEEAERAAWSAAGVLSVDNQISVRWD